MKKVMGWALLVIGCFLFGMFVYNTFFTKKGPVSPIPNNDEVRVILLSPPPSKK
jgi:hypothetical protein